MKLKSAALYLRVLFPSLRFCLKHLPLQQALRLPILVYKMHCLKSVGGGSNRY